MERAAVERNARPVFIGQLAHGRANNFNLLRVLAALAVLAQHAVIVTQGREAVSAKMWLLGSSAVWVFFVISGFLIAASFERASSRVDYCLARFLRIFPALAACVLLTALVIGPAVTSEPLAAYFGSSQTWGFIARNLTLYFDTRSLPGVFADHPHDFAQITFWTLKHEVTCYVAVLIFGTMGFFRDRWLFGVFFVAFLFLWVLTLRVTLVAPEALPEVVESFHRLSIYFVLGTFSYVYRDHVPLNGYVALALVPITVMLWWTPLFHVLLPATIAYGTLWLALVPKGPLLLYNRIGDYSYGIYIFAVPIQQLCVSAFGPQTPVANFFYALPVTCGLAVLSWYLIEKPSIRARKRLSGWSESRVRNGRLAKVSLH